eukprot:TRINITY_DN30_c0_g2_i4.p2 TRINITY_DN30_c0_g2~~TRINITY_DN30_c0_g2_i4.p2  ORF type:complete len:56 (+),score=4.88 TRINITY_DN30_c0_g2_i4:521-688(+)
MIVTPAPTKSNFSNTYQIKFFEDPGGTTISITSTFLEFLITKIKNDIKTTQSIYI